MPIRDRKKEHVELTLNQDVFYQKGTGFERYHFQHNALPEVDMDEVELSVKLLDRTFSFPVFVSSMTGGYKGAEAVNATLASFCEARNLPLGVGSQRAMLEDPSETESFAVVRRMAPTAFIAANIGGAQLIGGLGEEAAARLIDSIRADAVIVHLNPLQELVQPEGDRNFKGIFEGIYSLAESISIPVIVKETGAGISLQVAEKLAVAGVRVIDVAGAGGTSWARVENLRERQKAPLHFLDNWGIPTAECISEVSGLKDSFDFGLIASGGIRSSEDIVKAMALGADFTAMAQPLIKAVFDGGEPSLHKLLDRFEKECRLILTLLGCRSFHDLEPHHLRKVSA